MPICKSRGFRILRFWNNDILGNTEWSTSANLGSHRAIPLTPRPSAATLSHQGRGLDSASGFVMRYLEFATASNFSFLRGASHPEELMVQAAHLGLAGIGLCDRNSVAGVVRAHLAKREQNLPLHISPGRAAGLRRWHAGHPRLSARPRRLGPAHAPAHARQSARREGRLHSCISTICWRIASDWNWSFHLRPAPVDRSGCSRSLRTMPLPRTASRCAASMLYRGQDRARLKRLAALAHEAQVPLIAVNDVHYASSRPAAARRRAHLHPREADYRPRRAQARRQCRAPSESRRTKWRGCSATRRRRSTRRCALSEALSFSLDELRYEYPDEIIDGFDNAQDALRASHLPGRRRSATRTACPTKCAPASSTNWR